MFVACDLKPNEVTFLKVIKTPEAVSNVPSQKEPKTSLQIQGISPDNDVIFEFKNTETQLSQRFGFNLKYYRAH